MNRGKTVDKLLVHLPTLWTFKLIECHLSCPRYLLIAIIKLDVNRFFIGPLLSQLPLSLVGIAKHDLSVLCQMLECTNYVSADD